MDEYSRHIEKCRLPKKSETIKSIVLNIVAGVKLGLTSAELARKLNKDCIFTIMKKKWTANSLQMQVLKMVRLSDDSTLAWGLASLVKSNHINDTELALLQARVRFS